MFNKTITTDFFTTINKGIFLDTLSLLSYKLHKLRFGKYSTTFERKLRNYLGVNHSLAITYYRGSNAIFNALKIIGIKKGDEVIISAYTCIVVVNAVIQSGAKIVYCDIDKKNLGINPAELEKKISKKTKAVIIQHTFGKPSDIVDIVNICKKNKIYSIEDCAHSLGSKYKKQHVGTFGDFSIFSTGRDKVISSVTGGVLLINNSIFFKKAKQIKKKLEAPSRILTIKNLNYNLVAYPASKTYDILSLGKVIIYASRKLSIITDILNSDEKKCKAKSELNLGLPASLGFLAKTQLKKIKEIKNHRSFISNIYENELKSPYIKILFKKKKSEKLNYYRFPVLLKNKEIQEEFVNYMKSYNILIGTAWTGSNIVPKTVNISDTGYVPGSCKISEDISSRIVMLPNHENITSHDAEKISVIINNFKK